MGVTATRNILVNGKLAKISDLPTNTSDLTNDSAFITSAEIQPYHSGTDPTVNTGIANKAFQLSLNDHTTSKPVDGTQLAGSIRTLRDLTYEFRAKMAYATYYPYYLSKWNGQTVSPELPLYFCYDSLRYGTTRPRPYYDGYMFRTAGAGFAILCDENGTPTGTLVETTSVQGTYVLMANNTTSVHSIGFSGTSLDPYNTIVTIDDQTDLIYAQRPNAYRMYAVYEEIANKSELPTKTSDLTNDAGFITSAEVPTPDKIEDLSANVINADRTVSYIEEVANWTETQLFPNDPLNWDATNNWWRVDISPSFYLQLQFSSGTWTLVQGENIGGEWVEISDSVQDSEQATSL